MTHHENRRLLEPRQADPMILIVEDEAVSRRALTALFILSGYETQAVGSAEEALRLVQKGKVPKVALVDLDLPGISGLELIAQLEKTNPSIFSVLVTASRRELLPQNLRESEGVTYFRKPVDFNRLLMLISEKQDSH